MGLFKRVQLPTPRPHVEEINLENPTREDLQRIAARAGKKEGHRKGASFHFKTAIIQGKMVLLDGHGKILRMLDVEINSNMTEKEKERAIIKVKTELRSFARDLFVNYDGDTIQIGGFLFD